MTLRLGILGAGWFGREAHLKNLLHIPDVIVTAASSRSEESRQAARDLGGSEMRVFADWHDVLQERSLDAVIVALPNIDHHQAAMAALTAGKHVLCEKPLGLSIVECDELIDAADRSGLVLQVGHEMRHQRLYQKMKSLVDEGGVGDPRLMWCREYRGPMRPGWRSSPEQTGGMLLEKNCHHFDLFNWIFDAVPQRVTAFGGTDVLTDRDILDNAQVLVEYDGGRRAVLEICLFTPSGGDCEIGVVGTEGRIDTWNQAIRLVHHRFDPQETKVERVPDPDEAGFTDASGRVDRGIKAQLEHFLHCCRTGDRPLNDGRSARRNVSVCLAAQRAITSGNVEPVSVH